MAILDVDWNPDATMLRRFCVAGAIFFGGLAALALYKSWALAWLGWVSAGLALTLLVFAVVSPRLGLPLYVVLTALTFPLGIVISYVVLGILFFGVMTPIGMLFRLMGRDALQRGFDPKRESYWIEREPNTELKRYFRQF